MALAGRGDRVEGFHAVAAAVAAGRVLELLVQRSKTGRADYVELMELARRGGAKVQVVEDVSSEAATSAPQGVVATARPLPTLSLEALLARVTPPALMVVDHLEDAHNLGAIARSVEAAGLAGLVVPGRRGVPLGPAAFKAAAGALERIGVTVVSSIAAVISELKRHQVWSVGLAGDGATSLFGLELLTEPVAIVAGGEGKGLSELVRKRVDVLAAIPMAAGESLNASVAAALAAFEVARVRRSLPLPPFGAPSTTQRSL
jgi:23S rRNA (guanosine2251-2'-O)-methyltransferase